MTNRRAFTYWVKITDTAKGEMVETECEIDLVIEENGVLYPIEIKKSSSPKASDAAAFVVLDKIKGKKRGQGAIVCNCAAPMHLRGNLLSMPIWYL